MSVIERIERGEIPSHDNKKVVLNHNDFAELLALAKLGEKMRWIPVTERLPEVKVEKNKRNFMRVNVLVKRMNTLGFVEFIDATTAEYVSEGQHPREERRKPKWMDLNGVLFVGEITHWMPLPEPPEEEG